MLLNMRIVYLKLKILIRGLKFRKWKIFEWSETSVTANIKSLSKQWFRVMLYTLLGTKYQTIIFFMASIYVASSWRNQYYPEAAKAAVYHTAFPLICSKVTALPVPSSIIDQARWVAAAKRRLLTAAYLFILSTSTSVDEPMEARCFYSSMSSTSPLQPHWSQKYTAPSQYASQPHDGHGIQSGMSLLSPICMALSLQEIS